jgi:hypothetical protein
MIESSSRVRDAVSLSHRGGVKQWELAGYLRMEEVRPSERDAAMTSPMSHHELWSSSAFVSYRSELADWLASNTADDEELYRRSMALCAETHSAGVSVEQIIIALRASGVKPRWAGRAPGSRGAATDHRYTSAISMLVKCCFEGSR